MMHRVKQEHVQKLLDAIRADEVAGRVEAGGAAAFEKIGLVLNALLVVAGVRDACRLEYYPLSGNNAMDTQFIRCLGSSFGDGRLVRLVNFGGHTLEPLLVNVRRADPADVKVLIDSRGSDLQEPLVGAMGRLLGYTCPYPGSRGLRLPQPQGGDAGRAG